MSAAVRVLMVDNHDSFVHTLVGYLVELGAVVEIVEADEIDPEAVVPALAGYDGVVVSPGPGRPERAGASVRVVQAAVDLEVPLLGVCLGHQAVAVAVGARVVEAPELMHGQTSEVTHDGSALFEGLRSPFTAGRYHSLAVEESSLPSAARVTARTPEGTVMSIAHRTAPVHGVQFHPESVLTEGGYRLLANWLRTIGATDAPARAAHLSPHRGALSPSTRSA
ncbi:MAG: gamma-glutamyl-gamma-aminobutyrate hydrolase family protein [Microbacterium sp.]|uniref:anthranilate synthase component II n=1 Tax=Microbacterium sp. TaxID=51671 RepID=UPI0039E327A8